MKYILTFSEFDNFYLIFCLNYLIYLLSMIPKILGNK